MDSDKMHKKLKPFSKVLVRNIKGQKWFATLFSYYDEETEKYICVDGNPYKECLPFNKYKHLYNTSLEYKDNKKVTENEIKTKIENCPDTKYISERNRKTRFVFVQEMNIKHFHKAYCTLIDIIENEPKTTRKIINLYETIIGTYPKEHFVHKNVIVLFTDIYGDVSFTDVSSLIFQNIFTYAEESKYQL